jgi:hypothetical protein
VSQNGNKQLPTRVIGLMTERQKQGVAAALEKAFRHLNDNAGPARKDQRTHEFVFHMTDWYDDLAKLAALYERPEAYSQSTWNECVIGFLYHAVGHLLAAAKLNDTFVDTFRVLEAEKRRPARKKPKRSRAA